MKKLKLINEEKQINILEVIEELNLSNKNRINLHEPDSTLNIMVLKIYKELNDEKYHWNKDRDEIIIVLKGKIEVEFKLNNKISLKTLSEDKNNLFLLKANTPHRIKSLSSTSNILEIIGGQFRNGSTEYEK